MANTISAELLDALLEQWPVGRLATWGHAAPHVVPMVFCRDGNALFSPIDGKAKSSVALQRLQNVQHNPRYSLLLDRYSDDWKQLWWVRLDGSAQVYRPDAQALAVLVESLTRKYPQYQHTPVTLGEPTFLRLEWDSVASWAQEQFTSSAIRPHNMR